MRLYRFLNAEFGLRSIRERRLRIGRIEELNDDFEFVGLALRKRDDRVALRNMRKQLNVGNGVLCMSKDWESPLMWAHYADSHKGMVLGFDVPEKAYYAVEYIDQRPRLADFGLENLAGISSEEMKRLIKMKAAGWKHEKEYRAYIALREGEEINGQTHYFMPFSEELRLREVIVGLRYQGSRAEIVEAVADAGVDTFMARGAFKDFRVVRQLQDSMWS